MTDVRADIKAAVTRHDEQDARQMDRDIKEVLGTSAGRRLLVSMMFKGGVYTHSRRDDNHVYLAGRRDAALEVMHYANLSAPEQVLKARSERHETISARNAELRNIENQKGNGT